MPLFYLNRKEFCFTELLGFRLIEFGDQPKLPLHYDDLDFVSYRPPLVLVLNIGRLNSEIAINIADENDLLAIEVLDVLRDNMNDKALCSCYSNKEICSYFGDEESFRESVKRVEDSARIYSDHLENGGYKLGFIDRGRVGEVISVLKKHQFSDQLILNLIDNISLTSISVVHIHAALSAEIYPQYEGTQELDNTQSSNANLLEAPIFELMQYLVGSRSDQGALGISDISIPIQDSNKELSVDTILDDPVNSTDRNQKKNSKGRGRQSNRGSRNSIGRKSTRNVPLTKKTEEAV